MNRMTVTRIDGTVYDRKYEKRLKDYGSEDAVRLDHE
jgi:hypothetical protein